MPASMHLDDAEDIMGLQHQSIYAGIGEEEYLHLRYIRGPEAGPIICLLHGSLGNGKIFYSKSGKGLAPYLAALGFRTFSVDLRGRGRSIPPVQRSSKYGQSEALTEDLPILTRAIERVCSEKPTYWIAHSYGGVLLLSFLARHPELLENTRAIVCFASKRVIHYNSLGKWLALGLVWGIWGRVLCHLRGYVSGKALGFGDDSESASFYKQSAAWLRGQPWVDDRDGFDYAAVLAQRPLPPILHITGNKDHWLGDPTDIRAFIEEYGGQADDLKILGQPFGARRNYGHIDILTHPDAPADHFKWIGEWLRSHEEQTRN